MKEATPGIVSIKLLIMAQSPESKSGRTHQEKHMIAKADERQ